MFDSPALSLCLSLTNGKRTVETASSKASRGLPSNETRNPKLHSCWPQTGRQGQTCWDRRNLSSGLSLEGVGAILTSRLVLRYFHGSLACCVAVSDMSLFLGALQMFCAVLLLQSVPSSHPSLLAFLS